MVQNIIHELSGNSISPRGERFKSSSSSDMPAVDCAVNPPQRTKTVSVWLMDIPFYKLENNEHKFVQGSMCYGENFVTVEL